MPGIGPDAGTEPPPSEPELVSREVKPYSAITRVRQDPPEAPGPARHVKAHLPAAVAETFPQERLFLLVEERRKGLVIPFGMAVVPGNLGTHRDRLSARQCRSALPVHRRPGLRLVAPGNQADTLDCLT
jgi:hypothetical protein